MYFILLPVPRNLFLLIHLYKTDSVDKLDEIINNKILYLMF